MGEIVKELGISHVIINSPVPGTVAPVPGAKVRFPAKPTPVLGTKFKNKLGGRR